jgi:tetratricopeptide (TPR) repeat protein
MNRNTPLEEMLDNWAGNKISYEELQAFANRQGVKDLEREAEMHKALLEGLKNEYLKNRIANVHREFAGQSFSGRSQAKVKSIMPHQWLFRVAASILIITGLFTAKQAFFVSDKTLSNAIFTEYYMVNERNDDGPGANALTRSFLNKEFGKVVSLYEENNALPVREKFLSGYAYFNLGNFSKASEVFKQIMDQNKNTSVPLYKDEAEYYFALCALKEGHYTEAYQQFKNIRNNEMHTYHEKVSGLNLLRIRLKTF